MMENLGTLVRKLPSGTKVYRSHAPDRWVAEYTTKNNTKYLFGDTPEEALTELEIELAKVQYTAKLRREKGI